MSLRREKCRVLIPVVEVSVPLFVAIWSSARRNPICTLVAEGAKIDSSEIVTRLRECCFRNRRWRRQLLGVG